VEANATVLESGMMARETTLHVTLKQPPGVIRAKEWMGEYPYGLFLLDGDWTIAPHQLCNDHSVWQRQRNPEDHIKWAPICCDLYGPYVWTMTGSRCWEKNLVFNCDENQGAPPKNCWLPGLFFVA
jgi:hypothetical protein